MGGAFAEDKSLVLYMKFISESSTVTSQQLLNVMRI